MNTEIVQEKAKSRVKITNYSEAEVNSALEEMEKEGYYPTHVMWDGLGQKVTIWFVL